MSDLINSCNGPIGRAKGGHRRAESLTPEQRRTIAVRAAAARWGDKLPVATHKGSFRKEFGVDVECYVLNDITKTAVISQSGMGRALGLSSRGNAFPRFMASRAMTECLGAGERRKIEQPLKFQWISGGAQPPISIHGFDATLLVDVCQAILRAKAEGKLTRNQEPVARQAQIIIGASAKAGIKGLIYALAGYSPSAEEVVAAFKLYVQEEARKYEQEFPKELYMQWYRLYEIPEPSRGKPWHFKHLTVRHVYFPLAKSNGRILELLKALKSAEGKRNTKLFQFLNEIGARALRIQIGRILEMTESSIDRHAYELKIIERFGGQQELDFEVS